MIEVISAGKRRIILKRTFAGSIDCYFSNSYSKITAQNLATLCKIAYWKDPSKIRDLLETTIQSGKKNANADCVFRHFLIKNPIRNFAPFEYAGTGLSAIDTQGFSFEDPENLYIVFRGTELPKVRDWITNFSGEAIRFSLGYGAVHSGFNNAFVAVVPELKAIIDKTDLTKNIVVCGHSLGGALATLCAAWIRESYPREVMLYTFGSPRVGCRDFVDHYSNTISFPAFRVANPTDIVPSVPWDTASSTLKSMESIPAMVVQGPMGWLLDIVDAASPTKRYQHFGTPVSLRLPGYTIVGNPSTLDGEFMASVHQDWKRMTVKEFVASRMDNLNHHNLPEYIQRLHVDFLHDCRNWAFGDPAPFLLQLQKVNLEIAAIEPEIFKERAKVYGSHIVAEPDALKTVASRSHEVTSADRLKILELHLYQLRFQASILTVDAQAVSAAERNASLQRLTQRPFDGYLEEELLQQAESK